MTPDPLQVRRDRIGRLRTRYVRTDRDDEFRLHLDALLAPGPAGLALPEPRRFGPTREARGLIVTGASAQGKTSLIAHGLRAHPSLVAEDGSELRPVLSVDVPSPATLKSLGLEIAKASGFEFAGTRELQHRVWERVRHRLALLGVCVLWIDEAHDVFRTGTAQERHNILNTVKTLTKGEHAVIPILSGLPMLEEMIRSDAQVSRRMSKMVLRPVTWEADGANIRDVAAGYSATVGLACELDDEALRLVVQAADGGFGRIIEALIDGIEIAAEQGAAVVDRQHVAEAWAFREGIGASESPFFREAGR